jgi:hypothetical protein
MKRIALLLTAAIGTAAFLAFFYTSMMVNAADVATRVSTSLQSQPVPQ